MPGPDIWPVTKHVNAGSRSKALRCRRVYSRQPVREDASQPDSDIFAFLLTRVDDSMQRQDALRRAKGKQECAN
jgi:hypothetical protein